MAGRNVAAVSPRQLWNQRPTPTDRELSRHCTPFTLPSNGVLSIADLVITLTTNVVYQPECTGAPESDISTIVNATEPFYASVIPQTFVVAATTVIAWILVIMLIITPRTNFIGTAGSSAALSRGHGIIGGATGGGTSLIGVGSRPWLQKAAALTVAVALTIATSDNFEAAADQYRQGIMNADALRNAVLDSMEIRITRVISDVFVWLAQVQTLVRLFPRHKEKVLIKWIGFGLIVFDSIFSCLNSFLVNTRATRPRSFSDAIPALSYLFELALGLLYAAWVIYYAMTKRRYAFYHPKMRSICLIALLSLVAILTPVVFFVTDVSNQDVAVWGDYFRWVGAAAASVVVWEWVERIEALERDEKKDGILGREIFDGDEMLDVTPSEEMVWSAPNRSRYKNSNGGGNKSRPPDDHQNEGGRLTNRFRHRQQQLVHHFPLGRAHSTTTRSTPDPTTARSGNGRIAFGRLPKPTVGGVADVVGLTPPPPAASPINRGDTSSAGSTVYVVRYDQVANFSQPARQQPDANGNTAQIRARIAANERQAKAEHDPEKVEAEDEQPNRNRTTGRWHSVANPFKRKRTCLPAEVQQAREAAAAATGHSLTPAPRSGGFSFRNRFRPHDPTSKSRGGQHNTADDRPQHTSSPPIIVIPAQRRGLDAQIERNDYANNTRPSVASSAETQDSPGVSASTTLTANSQHPTAGPWPASRRSNTRLSPIQRQDDPSPLGAGGVTTHRSNSPMSVIPGLARSRTFSAPPRADDISPTAGTTAIIPAPRRSPLRRPDPSVASSVSVGISGASDARNTRGTGS